MAKQRVTIREIAAAAGVSTSAVSYVINGRKGVSDETRQRVQDVIDRYGYQPNINSVRLVSRRSFNIRIAIQRGSSPFDDLFFYEIAQSVVERSARAGYNIVFSHIGSTQTDQSFVDSLHQSDADGIIFFLDVSSDLLFAARDAGVPAVVIDGHHADPSITQVRADYAIAAETATDHLISTGHREIALLGSNKVQGYFDQVFTGFRRALDRAGLKIPIGWVLSNVNDESDARTAIAHIVEKETLPEGIVCASDLTAVGTVQELKQRGVAVPNQVSIVGIDDILLSRYVEPALTTVKIDKKRMGEAAVELLLQLMDGDETASHVVRSDNLITRASVATRN